MKNNMETRVVYKWLQDDDRWNDKARELRAEALEEEEPVNYLKSALHDFIREDRRELANNSFESGMIDAALANVDWWALAWWVINDVREVFPEPEGWFPGKGLDDEERAKRGLPREFPRR